jgi:hypothetical protein
MSKLLTPSIQTSKGGMLQELLGVFPEGTLVKLMGMCGTGKGLRSVLSIAASLDFLPAAAGVRHE